MDNKDVLPNYKSLIFMYNILNKIILTIIFILKSINILILIFYYILPPN